MNEKPYFQYFLHRNQLGLRWYWRLKARNNKTIAIGGEPFNSKEDVMEAIKIICRTVPSADKMYEIQS
jgi:uncharacterized protein YegP (UPF0339 family)